MRYSVIACITILLLLFTLEPGYCEKGVSFTMEMVSSVNERASTPNVKKVYIAGDKAVMEEHRGRTRSIYRFDLDKIWVLFEDKTYNELPIRKMPELSGARSHFNLEKTSETATISGFKCTKYMLSSKYKGGTSITNEIWVTENFPYKIDLDVLSQINPQFRRWMGLIKKESGNLFPLKFEMIIKTKTSVRVTHILKDFVKESLKEIFFELPKDYTKKEIKHPHEIFMHPEEGERMRKPEAKKPIKEENSKENN